MFFTTIFFVIIFENASLIILTFQCLMQLIDTFSLILLVYHIGHGFLCEILTS